MKKKQQNQQVKRGHVWDTMVGHPRTKLCVKCGLVWLKNHRTQVAIKASCPGDRE